MKLRTRIILGFTVIIAVLMIMGGISLIQFQSASAGFTGYRGLARDTNLAGRLQANMLMVRMNVKDFIITGSEHDREQYNEYLEQMNTFLEEAQVEIQNPERAVLVDKIDDTVTEYQSNFDEVYAFRAIRDDHVINFLDVTGPDMENALSDILISAEADEDMEAAFYSALAMKHLLLARLYVTKFLESNLESHVDRVAEEFGKMDDNLNILDIQLQNPERRRNLNIVIDAKEIYIQHCDGMVDIITRRNDIITNRLDVAGPQIADWVEEVKLSIKTEQDELGPQLESENKRAKILIIILLSTSIILGVVIALITITSILKQLGADPSDLALLAEEIAVGNLSNSNDTEMENTIGVFRSMIDMKEKVSEIVTTVLTGSEQIAAASEQLASGNQDLSNRTEQQASSLEETSSAIEEMNASIKSNADNTGTANNLSEDAFRKSEEGSIAVSKMVESMDEINISSNRIADIIEVINNIAFQTNLLALNASIEAARAGEQGKGFAVVAVEVRKLAKRSDKAANEITEIIKNSNKKVGEGVEIANQAGVVLANINDSVKKVTVLISEISSASQEQLSSADEIEKTLSSLDENTQRNAALVEEAASSTEELSAQAQELNTTMQFFKIDTAETGKQSSNQNIVQKKSMPSITNDKKLDTANSDSYQNFTELADEGDFDEF